MPRTTLLAYTHLRWESFDPRPRNILTRLAQDRRVLVVEPPLGEATTDAWERVARERNLAVFRPRLRGSVDGFAPAGHERLTDLLEDLVASEGVGRHSAWLSTPLAFPPARTLAPEVLVYDCMDELAAFPGAAPETDALEARLLRHADLVLTGGASQYLALRERHPNVHCFPSSVDVTHFRRGRSGQPVAEDYEQTPRPRLGYCGALDGRVDFALLGAVAAARPEWTIWLVGPVEDVDAVQLPQAPNLRYVGARLYTELPRHVAAWDVTLLPWKLDASTRSMSPARALEAMSAEHPIVSTPVRDVAVPYEDIVYLGSGEEGFIAACERALASGETERAARVTRMRAILAHTSWDHLVRRIDEQLRHVEDRSAEYGRTLEQTIGTLLRARAD